MTAAFAGEAERDAASEDAVLAKCTLVASPDVDGALVTCATGLKTTFKTLKAKYAK